MILIQIAVMVVLVAVHLRFVEIVMSMMEKSVMMGIHHEVMGVVIFVK